MTHGSSLHNFSAVHDYVMVTCKLHISVAKISKKRIEKHCVCDAAS